ncbi:MAG: DVUA0089 family protein [Acidobacteriia bacterium]|nr:DVUA0089 family protein [Terriglobia bacterium]
MTKRLLAIIATAFAAGVGQSQAGIISFTGDLRTDATFISCGNGCTLGAGNSDSDYAQWAAVERDFTVAASSMVQAITFSYGGGTNGHGLAIGPGGFEPYLSLFDASGVFLASTLFGVTCPPGANINIGSGQCFDVLLDAGVLGPGNYAITLSAFENMSFAENSGVGSLADGFTGLGNLAPGEDMHYAFDVTLQDASPSPVPEPASLGLMGCAVLLVFLMARKRTGNSTQRRSR